MLIEESEKLELQTAVALHAELTAALGAPGPEMPPEMGDYFSELLMVLKFVDS